MITFIKWLELKSKTFHDRTYLTSPDCCISYTQNVEKIKSLMSQIGSFSIPGRNIVFIGSSSIESYQIYFAVIAIQAIWVPVDYRFENEQIDSIIKKLEPSLIVYDQNLFPLKEKLFQTT